MHTKIKKKIGTVLDEELYRALKLYAASQNKPISEVIEEALSQYLRREKRGVVEETYGTIKIDQEVLEEILEEDYYDQ
jgi:predicted transcriptional regulator